jgi:hypothetical protein
MVPLLGHSSNFRPRSFAVLLSATAALCALIFVAASNNDTARPSTVSLRSTRSYQLSVQSEDRFVSSHDPYIKSMNGRGGIAFFDPRYFPAPIQHVV